MVSVQIPTCDMFSIIREAPLAKFPKIIATVKIFNDVDGNQGNSCKKPADIFLVKKVGRS